MLTHRDRRFGLMHVTSITTTEREMRVKIFCRETSSPPINEHIFP